MHEYPDGAVAVFWGPHRLGDYDAAGALVLAAAQDGVPAAPAVKQMTGSPQPGIASRDEIQGETAKRARPDQQAGAGQDDRHVTKRKGAK